jgi:hypothetical protein
MARSMTADKVQNYREPSGWAGESFLDLAKMEALGIGRYTAHEKINRIAFVPPRERGFYGKKIWVHYSQGMDKNAWLCPRFHSTEFMSQDERAAMEQSGHDPKRCVVCETWKHHDEIGSVDKIKNHFSYKKRMLLYVIDTRTEESIAEGVQLYDAPMGRVDGTAGVGYCLKNMVDQDIELENFRDMSISKKFDFVFTRTGTSQTGTGYSGHMIMERKHKIPKAIIDAAMELPEIEDLLLFKDAQHIAGKMGAGREELPEGKPATLQEAEEEVEAPTVKRDKLTSDLESKIGDLDDDGEE